MSEDISISELNGLVWDIASRMAVVVVLGLFGVVNLQLLSLHADAFTTAEITRIRWVFNLIGVVFVIYIGLPLFEFGITHRDTRFGKALLIAVPTVVCLSYVLGA